MVKNEYNLNEYFYIIQLWRYGLNGEVIIFSLDLKNTNNI